MYLPTRVMVGRAGPGADFQAIIFKLAQLTSWVIATIDLQSLQREISTAPTATPPTNFFKFFFKKIRSARTKQPLIFEKFIFATKSPLLAIPEGPPLSQSYPTSTLMIDQSCS